MSDKPKESYVFHRAEAPIFVSHGKGVYVWDTDGRRYLDGSGGPLCVGIGHGIEEIVEKMKTQAGKIAFAHAMHLTCEPVEKFAEKVAELSPGNLKKVFPCSGGSEAMESAIKLARQYFLEKGESKRYKIISRWLSYHGNTLGALSASGHPARREKYNPLLLDFPHIAPAYCYRCWFRKEYPGCDLECARDLEREIRATGPEYVSAFVAEPIVGSTLGSVPAPKEYFKIIRETCDRFGILFISDEVQTGFGRTGKNFGIEHYGVLPDMMVCAKGIASGYAALGAVVASTEIFEPFKKALFVHGYTYGGNPLSCATGLAVLEYLTERKLVSRVAGLEKVLFEGLEEIKEKHKVVGDVRGKGLMGGIEFVKDKKSKEIFPPKVGFGSSIVQQCFNNGLLIYSGGGSIEGLAGDQVQVAPMLISTEEQVREITSIIDRSIGEVEEQIKL
jgi:adenosylmethionine-8-amino-7-oxononanoate aminotransferase